MKKLFSVLLTLAILMATVLSMALPASAENQGGTCGAFGSDITWSFDAETGELSFAGTGEMTTFSGAQSLPWIELVGDVKTATFGEGITKITAGTLYNCTQMTKLNLPSTLQTVERYALQGCSALPTITIPAALTNIGTGAFMGCTGLMGFTVEEGNPAYTAIGGDLYSKDLKTFVQYAAGKPAEAVWLPTHVTAVGEAAFAYSKLKSVTIPEGVTTIGSAAFGGCERLVDVSIPETVTSIGVSAFSMCTELTDIVIPNSVTGIGNSAFYKCPKLKNVVLPDTLALLENGMFMDCTSLERIYLPKTVASVGSMSFSGCTSLKKIYFGGTEEAWNNVEKNEFLSRLENVEILFHTEHTLGDWTLIKPAAPGVEGCEAKICSDCGYQETRKLDALPAETVAATTTTQQVPVATTAPAETLIITGPMQTVTAPATTVANLPSAPAQTTPSDVEGTTSPNQTSEEVYATQVATGTPQVQTNAGTGDQTQAPDTQKSGCGAVLSSGAGMLCLLCASAVVLGKKKQD